MVFLLFCPPISFNEGNNWVIGFHLWKYTFPLILCSLGVEYAKIFPWEATAHTHTRTQMHHGHFGDFDEHDFRTCGCLAQLETFRMRRLFCLIWKKTQYSLCCLFYNQNACHCFFLCRNFWLCCVRVCFLYSLDWPAVGCTSVHIKSLAFTLDCSGTRCKVLCGSSAFLKASIQKLWLLIVIFIFRVKLWAECRWEDCVCMHLNAACMCASACICMYLCCSDSCMNREP